MKLAQLITNMNTSKKHLYALKKQDRWSIKIILTFFAFYRTYEAWRELGLSPYAKLAFRLFTMIPQEQIPEIINGLNLNFNADENTGTNQFEYVFNLPVDKPQNGDNLTFAYLVTFMLSCLEEHNYFANNKVTHEDAVILLYKYKKQ